jgi:hypothetical protein
MSSIPPVQTEPEATLLRLRFCDPAFVRGDVLVLDEVGGMFVARPGWSRGVNDEPEDDPDRDRVHRDRLARFDG